MWKIGQIQCVFSIFSALKGNFYTRFSPPRVAFVVKTENEGVPARSVQISLALKTFRQCTFNARKCLKSLLRTVSASGCLNPLQKLQLVSCGLVTLGVTPYIAFLHLYTCVRLYFGYPLGQFSTFSSFSWHQIGTFITTEGQNTAFRALYQFSRALKLLFLYFSQSFLGSIEH